MRCLCSVHKCLTMHNEALGVSGVGVGVCVCGGSSIYCTPVLTICIGLFNPLQPYV